MRRETSLSTMVLALFLVVASRTPAQQIPTGFKTFDHKDTGLRLYYPAKFEATPTPPTEKLVLAVFARSTPLNARPRDRDRHPESFAIFCLQPMTTSQDGAAPADEKPTSYADVVAKQNAIHDWKTLLKSRFGQWEIDTESAQVDESENSREYALVLKDFRQRGTGENERRGYLYVREGTFGTVGIVGTADSVVYDKVVKDYRRVGKSIYKPKGYAAVKDDSEDVYKGKEGLYRDIPFRIQARREMIAGWKAIDTENFFLVFDTKNESLVRQISVDLEAVRPFYMQFFPPTQPINAVSVVRVCEDRDEYLKYGGMPMSAGYWNFVAKELVFYDASKKGENEDWKKKARPIDDTFIVLYHEAFHQYIFYAAGEVSPHYWFNEGLGDFFSGIDVFKDSRRIKGVELNRWRIPVVKQAVETPRFVSLDALLKADRSMYYNPQLAQLMYSEGWAFCYFLMKSDEAQNRPEWKGLIPRYFEALKEGQKIHVDTMGEAATLEMREAGKGLARDKALAVALEGIDVKELDDAWRDWIRKTKDPWAAERKK